MLVRGSTLAIIALLAAAATPVEARIGLERIATLREPMYIASAPGDRRSLYVAERSGRVRVIRRGRLLRGAFVDLSRVVDIRDPRIEEDHGGLYSIAFAPDYARSRRLYAFYSHRDGSLRIDEIRRGSRRLVLRVPDRSSFDLGGQIAFGPDRMLYVGLGDQSTHGSSRELGDLRGKLLRIDPRRLGRRAYRVPRGNPFLGTPGARAEVWAYGLRNPFRFSFAPGGSLIVGDVGESRVEEIDVIPPRRAGADLGWDIFEGRERVRPGDAPAHIAPVIEHSHSLPYCSIIGGLVVRDRSLSVRGRYVYSDFCNGRLRSARLVRGSAVGDRAELPHVIRPVAFGEDARRRVYLVTLSGPVYRLVRR